MNAASKFRLLGALTFVFVVVAFYVFVPERFTEPVFAVAVLLFAASIGMQMYWRVGNDPATAAIGLALVLRPLLVVISLIAVICAYFVWNKTALVFELLWLLGLVAYWVLISTTKQHIQSVQNEHKVSAWYRDTDARLKELELEFTGDNREAFRQLTETFRLSNRFDCQECHALEAEITQALSTVTAAAEAGALNNIEKLIARRNLIIRRVINEKKD